MRVSYRGQDKACYPEEVSSTVPGQGKETVAARLGQPGVGGTPRTPCPPASTTPQRQPTNDAGAIAGRNRLGIINLPRQPADTRGAREPKVLVFDLGGSTFDVRVPAVDAGVFKVPEAGDACPGGENFGDRLVSHFMKDFRGKHGEDVSGNKQTLRRLRTACESAACTPTSCTQATPEISPCLRAWTSTRPSLEPALRNWAWFFSAAPWTGWRRPDP